MIIKLFGDSAEINPRDFVYVILPDLDYDSQLISIRHLLRNHENLDKELDNEIREIEVFAKNTHGIRNEHTVNAWMDRLHSSVYQSAAHSMSAVGMLAPLMESMFYQAFHGIHENLFTDTQDFNNHIRWEQSENEKWDCHFVWGTSGRKDDLVRGIMQLSDATGLTPLLPDDIEIVLKVLFSYRNKMFHCGFEWPVVERNKFWNRIQNENWPLNWLEKSTYGEEPWIIYLTGDFIQHCINTIEQAIDSLGMFVVKNKK